uniref:Uncharacterized protein n=1 Tax=Podarcis muralis TaxID=64176 RepID=A0A670KJE3_PODMU
MQTSSLSDIHLNEWQKNHFVVISCSSTQGQKVDAYDTQILHIQYT